MAAIVVRSVEASSDQDYDDVAHFVCCRDMNMSFCGADVTEAGWVDDDTTVCADCELISGSPNSCPFGGRCPE